MKINLGCGKNYKKGWVNIDINPDVKPDKIMNLEGKIEYPDNSVEEIYCSHVIEHINDRIKFLEEMYRISKNNAIITIKTPYMNNIRHIDHKAQFDESTFTCLDHRFLKKHEKTIMTPNFKFELISIELKGIKYISWIYHILPIYFWKMLFNFCIEEMTIKYKVVK